MFKTEKELKDFILWCKANKVKSFKNNDTNFELSELSFVPELTEKQMEKKVEEAYDHTLIDTAKQELDKEDEELLYWSSNK